MLKKGPELKKPNVKVPDFLLDIYHDLRERHLLPLVAILLVALVALPIALTRGSSESESSEAGGGALAAPSAVPTSDLVVAKATPGLRDYRRRLDGRSPKDPFVQQYTDSSKGGNAVGSASSSIASSESGEVVSEDGGATAPFGGEPGTETEGGDETTAKYATDTIDVRIVRVNSEGEAGTSTATPTVRRNVPELTMLPGRDTPVVVFMGASSDGKKALLLISSDVQSAFGDGRCVVGSKVCQLMALEKGLPETFVYGPQARTYRLEILSIDRTLSDKPQRAALGEPKKQGKAEDAG